MLFIALIFGLIYPTSFLRWTNKPTRLKVIGYWFLATATIVALGITTKRDKKTIKFDEIELAKRYLEEERYSDAIFILKKIEQEDPQYIEAHKLSMKADSMNIIF